MYDADLVAALSQPATAPVAQIGIRLDEQQKAVVLDKSLPIVLIAGPGTGKSTTLTLRLLQNAQHYRDKRHLGITFSRIGVERMQALVNAHGEHLRARIDVLTTHQMARRVVREVLPFFSARKSLTLIVDLDHFNAQLDKLLQSDREARDAYRLHGGDNRDRQALWTEISRARTALVQSIVVEHKFCPHAQAQPKPNAAVASFGDICRLAREEALKLINDRACDKETRLKASLQLLCVALDLFNAENGCYDLSGLLEYGTLAMRYAENAAQNLVDEYASLCYDEFQDASVIDLLFMLPFMHRTGMRMMVAGDPLQTIYGFRGSLGIDGFWRILNLIARYGRQPLDQAYANHCYMLSKNYRNHPRIAQLGLALVNVALSERSPMSNAARADEVRLTSSADLMRAFKIKLEHGEKLYPSHDQSVWLMQAQSPDQACKLTASIISAIVEYRSRNTHTTPDWSKIAIIYPSAAEIRKIYLDALEQALNAKHIPFSSPRNSMWRTAAARTLRATLALAVGQYDIMTLQTFLKHIAQASGHVLNKSLLQSIEHIAAQTAEHLIDVTAASEAERAPEMSNDCRRISLFWQRLALEYQHSAMPSMLNDLLLRAISAVDRLDQIQRSALAHFHLPHRHALELIQHIAHDEIIGLGVYRDLTQTLVQRIAQHVQSSGLSPVGLLDWMESVSTGEEDYSQELRVQLMSEHQVKGLEFGLVFWLGANHLLARNSDAWLLFNTIVTRARENLVIVASGSTRWHDERLARIVAQYATPLRLDERHSWITQLQYGL